MKGVVSYAKFWRMMKEEKNLSVFSLDLVNRRSLMNIMLYGQEGLEIGHGISCPSFLLRE